MPSSRRLAILALIFIAAVTGSFALWKWARPAAVSKKALTTEESVNVQKVVYTYKETTLQLEKSGNFWMITAPSVDRADPATMDRLTGLLSELEIGSVISEKAEKYAQFELDPAQVSHVQVYVSSATKPVLDMYVGKPGNGYNEAYVRLEGQKEVRLATGLPVHVFRLSYEDWRFIPDKR